MSHVMVLNGTMYMGRPHDANGVPVAHGDSNMIGTLREIFALTQDASGKFPPLPDLEVLINSDDYDKAYMRDHPHLPLLSITKEAGISADILYPAGHYSSDEKAKKSMGAIGRAPGDAVAARYRVPWARKQEKALFRGRPNTHTLSRYALPYLARDGPPRATSLLDVGLVFYHHLYDPFWKANHSLTPLTLADEQDMAAHARAKYLLNLDGHSYAHRLVKILALDSLVVKEETLALEFYYHLVKPNVHYLPFYFSLLKFPTPRPENIRTDLIDVLEGAQRNDTAMRAISDAGRALVHTHLCDAARQCYLYELLRRYARRMTYRPSLDGRPHAVRIDHERQLGRRLAKPISAAEAKPPPAAAEDAPALQRARDMSARVEQKALCDELSITEELPRRLAHRPLYPGQTRALKLLPRCGVAVPKIADVLPPPVTP